MEIGLGLVICLIIVGILLILAEVFLTPGVGIWGILGIASMTASSYLSFTHLGTTAGMIVTAVNVCLIILLICIFLRRKTWKRFELGTVIDTKPAAKPLPEPGTKGTTITRLAPMGTARFADCDLEVTSDAGMVDPGVEVEVSRKANGKIYVKPL